MASETTVEFVLTFNEPEVSLVPRVLAEVAVFSSFSNKECRHLITPEVHMTNQMVIPVTIRLPDLLASGKLKTYDTVTLEVIAFAPPFENEGRKGYMKNGNVSFTLQEMMNSIPLSGLDEDGTRVIAKPITLKTDKGMITGSAQFQVTTQAQMEFFQDIRSGKYKFDDESPLSQTAQDTLINFQLSKIDQKTKSQIVQQYLLDKSGTEGFTPNMEGFIIYLFQTTKWQPITNFFYMPEDRTTDHGDLKDLYPNLFRRSAEYYCRFMSLDKPTRESLCELMGSKVDEKLKMTQMQLEHLSNIYVMGVCLLSQSLPYLSDQSQHHLTSNQMKKLMEEAQLLKTQGKCKTEEELKEKLTKLWFKAAEETVHGIESFEDCFALESPDCEDSCKGIMIMHNAFVHYVNSPRAKDEEFQMPLMARIGLNYVCLACLASVTSARPTAQDYEKGVYPKMDEKWRSDSQIGGHMFAIFVPLRELQKGGAFYKEGKTLKLHLDPVKGSLAEELSKLSLLNLPVLCGEGTGYGNPAPSVWQANYAKENAQQWMDLQARAVEDSEASASLLSKLGIRSSGSTMVSRELKDKTVTGNYFYKMVGICFTGTNYLYRKSDQFIPNAFVWVDTKHNTIGASTTQIMYKENSCLVALDDFYSKEHLEDPTQTKEWKLFHKLKHYMRPTQIPKNYPMVVQSTSVGVTQGKSFTWFFHPKDFSDQMRTSLKKALDMVVQNYKDPKANGHFTLHHIDHVNGYTITEPATFFATMTYCGNADSFLDRRIGRVEVTVYYQ